MSLQEDDEFAIVEKDGEDDEEARKPKKSLSLGFRLIGKVLKVGEYVAPLRRTPAILSPQNYILFILHRFLADVIISDRESALDSVELAFS